MNAENTQIAPLELTLRRTFDAPRKRVFDAWTNTASSVGFWGPTSPAPGSARDCSGVFYASSSRPFPMLGFTACCCAPLFLGS